MIRFLSHTLRPVRYDDDGPIDYWLIHGPTDPDRHQPPVAGGFPTRAQAEAWIIEARANR
jgi:hypothetical protein